MSSSEKELELQRSWVTNAEAWTDVVREQGIASRKAGTDEAILQAVSERVKGRILDVGCGEGWLARALAERGFEVVGIDGSAALIARAQEAGGATFRTLSYEEISANPASLEGPYTAAVCNFSLLGENLIPLLTTLKAALSENGLLFIQTVHPFNKGQDEPYREGWRTETFSGFGDSFKEAMPWYYRTIGSWVRLLTLAGFTLVDCVEPVHPVTAQPLSLLLVGRK